MKSTDHGIQKKFYVIEWNNLIGRENLGAKNQAPDC